MRKLLFLCTLPIITLVFSQISQAASFQSLEQSAARLGAADSGTTTNTDDAAIEFYNPGGMAFVDHSVISASAIGVLANIKIRNATATTYGGIPVTGSMSGPKSRAIVPGLHIVMPMSNHFAWGFGVNVPYGLETVYPANSIVRYFATTSKIDTANVGLSAGFKFNDHLGFGLGIDAEWMWAELDQVFDLTPIFPTIQNPTIQNKGHDWAYGYNAGIMYVVNPKLRFGLAYRSAIHHHLVGSSRFINVNPMVFILPSLAAALQNSGAYADLTLPASTTFSVQYQATPKWRLSGDVEYTQWNVLRDLTLHFTNPARSPSSSTIMLKYHNAWRVSVGQSYKITKKLTLRNGFAFDQTPTDTVFKTARIPDANRYWVTVGANYKFSKRIDVDAGYAFILFAHSHISLTQNIPGLGNQTISAGYRATANLVGAQINYHFDK